MPQPRDAVTTAIARFTSPRAALPALFTLLQTVAATYFTVDFVSDCIEQAGHGVDFELAMEAVACLALASGVVLGLRHLRATMRDLARKEKALTIARGALAQHIAQRFEEWRLTPSEADVALFALKGYDIARIAALRGAAAGTVRSQLSQVYTKAQVTNQAMLVSLFIEDLLAVDAVPAARTIVG